MVAKQNITYQKNEI